MSPFLPPEILGMIISYIFDIETLLALRLVNRTWHDAVDYIAVQLLYVDLMGKNLTRFESVSQMESLRDKVRTLVWNLPDRPHWNCFSASATEPEDQETVSEKLARALSRMHLLSNILKMRTLQNEQFTFPNLAHLAIHFRPPPISDGECYSSFVMKSQHLRETFERTFMGFEGFYGLNEMSILNIPLELTFPQWIRLANISHWVPVGQVMHGFGLKSLRLSFVGPGIWSSNNGERTKPQPAGLTPLLIWPVRLTLRHLSLSYWGFYMKNPPGSIPENMHLPHLQSLELRSCGFTSRHTLTWILSHGHTLRSLKFDDCAIIYSMELAPSSKHETGSSDLVLGIDGGRVYQVYKLVWAMWFQALAKGLPHLQQFEFGSSRVRAPGEDGPKFNSETREGPKFGQINKFLFGLFPDRYLEMKDGTATTPWVLRAMTKRRKYKDRPESNEPDIWALRQLLAATGQVVQEDDTSNHAAKVIRLIGSVED